MPGYYSVGEALVTESELLTKKVTGELDKFLELSRKGEQAELLFSTGLATASNLVATNVDFTTGSPVPWKPVGLNKPLIVEIRHVYTGAKLKTNKKKDLLLTSAVKNIASWNAEPRAVNFLQPKIGAHDDLTTPAATEKGTPLVFYSPALVQESSVMTVEFGYDEFPDEFFGYAADAFQGAAGIPIFASVSPYLLGAGILTRLAGKLASKIFDRAPVFRATETLRFESGGIAAPQAGYMLLSENDLDKKFKQEHRINGDGVLEVTATSSPYEGDLAYVVLALDGREKESLKEFAPTAASAALLKRFYKINEGDEQPLEPLLEALKLYNDLRFRNQADDVQKELEGLDQDAPDYAQKKKELEEKLKALKENILNEVLQPK